MLLSVSSQNDQSLKCLDSLQEVVNFQVCIPVVTVFDPGAFSEKDICFVKEKDCASFPGSIEHSAKIFFGLTDVFVHDCRKIDAIEAELKFASQRAGCG